MALSNIDFLINVVKSLSSENYRVVIDDHSDERSDLWVSVKVLYDKIVDGVQTEMQAFFTVHWISEHIWCVEISNGSACWEVITEINSIAAFYMAVGFEFVNE